MKEHEFTLILAVDPDEEQAEKLYSIFNDGTVVTISGTPQIDFHRQAPDLEQAIRSAIADVKLAGIEVDHVTIHPEMLAT